MTKLKNKLKNHTRLYMLCIICPYDGQSRIPKEKRRQTDTPFNLLSKIIHFLHILFSHSLQGFFVVIT